MWTLPNIITIVRICFTPVIALLPFIAGYWPKLICLVIFIAAAVSDVFDGYLARSRKQVTDLGILLDPIADKLLLFSTLIPIYWISRQRHDLYDIPLWGSIPLWVCALLIGVSWQLHGGRNPSCLQPLSQDVGRRLAGCSGIVVAEDDCASHRAGWSPVAQQCRVSCGPDRHAEQDGGS